MYAKVPHGEKSEMKEIKVHVGDSEKFLFPEVYVQSEYRFINSF